MDLTKAYPRSPNEMLDLPMLPRTIDKARAVLDGTLGEYVYGAKSSFASVLTELLRTTAQRFSSASASALAAAGADSPVSLTPLRAEDRAVVFSDGAVNRRSRTLVHQVLSHQAALRHRAGREERSDL